MTHYFLTFKGFLYEKLLLALTILFSVNVFASPVNINNADAHTIADSLANIGLKKLK